MKLFGDGEFEKKYPQMPQFGMFALKILLPNSFSPYCTFMNVYAVFFPKK